MLKKIKLLRERVADWEMYPFSVPAIRTLDEISFRSRICFFAGENGTGKSTLLESIALHYGFGAEGGNRSFRNNTTKSNQSVEPLVRALRMSFDKRTGAGFFLRAESFFNAASFLDEIDDGSGVSSHLTEVRACTSGRTAKPSSLFSNTNFRGMACSCSTSPKPRSHHNPSYHFFF